MHEREERATDYAEDTDSDRSKFFSESEKSAKSLLRPPGFGGQAAASAVSLCSLRLALFAQGKLRPLFPSGTGSYPHPPQGWHLRIRRSPSRGPQRRPRF